MIDVVVNGAETSVVDGTTVADLIAQLQLAGPVAVERNRAIVPRAQHSATKLVAGDKLELVTFVGGGQ